MEAASWIKHPKQKETDLNSLKSSQELRNYVECKNMEHILDMIEEVRRAGARNLFQKAKPKLRAWRSFVVVTGMVRIVCFALLIYVAFSLRYGFLKHMVHLPKAPRDQRLDMAQATFELLAVCSILGALVELFICVLAWLQIPKYISYVFAISSILVFIILSCVAVTAHASDSPSNFTIQLMGRANSAERNYETWKGLQTQLQCCGFDGSSDWTNWKFAEFKDHFYESLVVIDNNLDWMSECAKETNEIACTVPPSCCKEPSCYQTSATQNDISRLLLGFNNKQHAPDSFISAQEYTHSSGCVAVLSDKLDSTLFLANITSVILAIFSLFMLILLNTAMLHHDSIGHINKKITKLDPARRDIFVNFFLWMDGLGSDFDLSQLSSIEEIIRGEING